jgi:hypothetical protein
MKPTANGNNVTFFHMFTTCNTDVFFPEKLTAFSGIGWNSILRKACENASDPV